MKKHWQKILSVLLCVLMVAAMAPTTFAAELDFTIEDGVLTKYSGSGGDVVIPDNVTSIGWHAFSGCTGLTGVTIPNSVTRIDSFAFFGCTGLTSVTIPDSVVSIRYDAFGHCTNLTSIDVSSGNTSYVAEDGVLFSSDMTTLHTYPAGKQGTYTIPSSVTSIAGHAFSYCRGLTGVTIPDSVTSIGYWAFESCSGLTSVTIPSSVTTIGKWVFPFCIHLTAIQVDAGNQNYVSVDGVLFTAAKDTLILHPAGKQGAYSIPNSVTGIDDYAFRFCTGLTSVTIPSSVTGIGNYAFYECTGLTDVYYGGSKAQWGAVTINDYNDPLKNAAIHYNSTGSVTSEIRQLSAVKYVPYSEKVIPNWYPTWTVTGTEGFQGWMEFRDGVLSGVPTEAGEFEFAITVYDGGGDYTYRFALTVADSAGASADSMISEGYEIEQPMPEVVTDDKDHVFEVEDIEETVAEVGSNYQRFLDVYLDGVKLKGGKVDSLEQAEAGWEYYAQEGSTKITIFAQTFQNKPEGTHTIAATFQALDGSENKVDSVAENFTIKRVEPEKPAEPEKQTEPEKPTESVESAETLRVGDIVNFTGAIHYTTAYDTQGFVCKPGQAKITRIYTAGGKHHYHLIAVSGGGSTVYGWVDGEDIAEIADK